MATAENTSSDSSTDTEEDSPEWEVTAKGMTLRKATSYVYEIEYGGQIQRFKEIRDVEPSHSEGSATETSQSEVTDEEDKGYELRGSDYFTLGYFDPDHEDVPAEIGTAFKILAAES
jgi:hypothetical protein